MKKSLLSFFGLTLSVLGFGQAPVTFNFTGGVQTYTVPPCVTSVNIQCFGAQGANAAVGGTGGLGGSASGILAVTPGDVLYIYVGGQNGYNGGGQGAQNGNTVFSGSPSGFAGNGGGASDVRVGGTGLANRVIVAGGGGGAGHNGTWPGCQVAGPAGNGGVGGGLTAGAGGTGVGTPCNCAGGGGAGGQGGTAVAGGTAGSYAGNTACLRSNWAIGQNGILGIGGDGSLVYYNGTGGGGGGGGGYYGGGAGGSGSDTTPGGGGGGGSSFTGTLTSTSTTSGTNSGNGSIVITPTSSVPSAPSFSNGTTNMCAGTSQVFSVSSVVGATGYTWSVPAGSVITSGQGTSSIVVSIGTNSGTVSVTADNSCGSSTPATLAITINALPNLIATASNGSICINSSDTLSVSGANTYTWSSGGNTSQEIVMPTSNTTYSVIGIDANGCADTAIVTVNVNDLPIVDLGSDVVQCEGVVSLDAQNNGATYSWSSGGSGQVETVSVSGIYTVSVTDNNGCTNSDTISVTINPNPVVTAEAADSTVCVYSADVTLIGTPANGLWTGPGVTGSLFDPSVGAGVQVLTYTFMDANGCENSASVSVTVDGCASISEASFAEFINLFPNPNNGTFTLSINANLGHVNLDILDLQGRVVFKLDESNIQTGYTKEIILKEQASGVYTLRIQTPSESYLMKMQVSK